MMANLTRRGESERGTVDVSRSSPFGGMLDWDPFRSLFPSGSQLYGLDVTRTDDGYDIEMATPGFRPEDLDISYQDGVITVVGQNDRRTLRRSFTVPEDIDENQINADVEHGVLTLHLKQNPQRQPKRIQVQSGRTGTIEQERSQPSSATTR